MTYVEIWNLPVAERLAAFVERYNDLGEHTGNRTTAERDEMEAIADVILPEMIRRAVSVRHVINGLAYECPSHHMTGVDSMCRACDAKNKENPYWPALAAIIEAMRTPE